MSNINQHAVLITFFPDEYAFSKDEERWTLPVLADEIRVTSEARKDRLPFLKLARFGEKRSRKNCLRWDLNTQEVTGLEIDYDEGTMPFGDAVQAMKAAGVRSLLYTSASYVAGKKEKWRVLAPFSKAYPPKYREEMVAVVNGILGGVAAKESFTLSQSFYYGCVNDNPEHRVEVIDGDFVDLRPDLAARAIGRSGKTAAQTHIVHQDNTTVSPGRDDAEILQLLKDSRKKNPHGGGQWHNSMVSATASMIGKGWSDAQIYDACAPYCDGQWGDEEIAELIESGRLKWKAPDPDKVMNKIAPIVAAAIEAKGGAVSDAPAWLERYVNGQPRPSFYNAGVAIAAEGVKCREDVFHHRVLMDDEEVSDSSILALRGRLLGRYRFDLSEKHVRDAVMMLAHANRFNPVADMLAEAEVGWDGVERLNRMAADYFNCEDTELNAQCLRKTMIAAVARVRRPGCKFDTILVTESKEGWNKSSAWMVLAGEGNFSDASIIGHHGREVQEQLAGIWIHENPELAGMKKADVEVVKAFASRQVDRARPAYGHFLVEQKRHSIEVGTTNSDRYLQSPSGNRRFWPMQLLRAIDLAKLRKDRLQLWGEAAHYQSQGESLVLDERLWEVAAVEQEARRVLHPWEALIDGMAEVPNSDMLTRIGSCGPMVIRRDGAEQRVHTIDIFRHVIDLAGSQMHRGHAMVLQEIMVRKGWKHKSNIKIDGKQGAGYVKTVRDTGIIMGKVRVVRG